MSIDWKLADITAIYGYEGAKKVPGNYTPVSLTSVCGNFMGKVILGTVEINLEINVIIRHSQHGFNKVLFNLFSTPL